MRTPCTTAVRTDVGREFLVAWPTVKAVLGEKVVPAYIDRKLGPRWLRERADEQSRADPDTA